jgi:hypothetical protein
MLNSMNALSRLQYTNYPEIWICMAQFGRPLCNMWQQMSTSMSVCVLQENQSSTDNVSTA